MAKRALALTAVVCRGFIEDDPEPGRAEKMRGELIWLQRCGIDDEFEAHETSLLSTQIGKLNSQMQVNATWRSEGLVVLAWALGRHDLPPHDQMVDPKAVADSLGFMGEQAVALIKTPTLRAEADIIRYSEMVFALHWRLTDFGIRPAQIDFEEFAKEAWFGPLEIDGLRLVEGDLAIGDKPIAKAAAEEVQQCQSIALERHRAVNWLRGYYPVYSEVPIDT